jgi:hypothetical protein
MPIHIVRIAGVIRISLVKKPHNKPAKDTKDDKNQPDYRIEG